MLLKTGTDTAARAGHLTARLDRLPATRTIWTLVAMLSLAFFFELYAMLLSGYIAPGLVADGIFTTTTAGFFGMSGVASFIASLFAGLTIGTAGAGSVIDRYGRRRVFTYALLGYTAANVFMAFQDSSGAINAWRFLAGLGLGVEMVTINTYISELVPKHLRGRAFAFSQAVGFSAVPVIAVLAWLLVPIAPFGVSGWRWVVFIGAIGAAAAWYIRLRLPESPRWLVQVDRLDEAEAVIERLERQVERESGRALPPPGPAEPVIRGGRFAELWEGRYRSRTIMMIVFNIFQTIGYYGFTNWVPTLLVSHGVEVTKGMAYTALIALAAPLGPLLGLAIGDRYERKWIIVAGAAAIMMAGTLFALATAPVLLVLLGVVLTIAGNTISFAYHGYQTEIFPTRIRAKAVGFVYAFSRASAMLNAFVIAFVLREGGVSGVFAFIVAAYAIVIVAIAGFGPRTTGRSLEEISA